MGTDTKSRKRDESSAIDAATVLELGGDILRSPVFAREDEARHHGDTTTLEHTLLVALLACRLARRRILSPRVDLRLLVRACLLHDLYLYDWHNPDTHGGLHGFRHPRVAASNAVSLIGESDGKVISAIETHMFPLTARAVPRHWISWILCLADKEAAIDDYLGRSGREGLDVLLGYVRECAVAVEGQSLKNINRS